MAHLPSSLCGLFLLLLAAFLAPVQAAGRSVPSDVPVNDGFYNAYILPLTYATPDFILDELNLYVRPDTGNSTLKRREILCNGVKIEGIESIGPERYDNSLVIFATHNGFKAMKALIKSMDTPFAVKAALRGRFFPRLRVKVTFLGGPIPTQLVKMGNATLRSGKKVPMYLQPWGQNFPVLLRVTNSSAVLQSFVTFGCTWDQNWQVRAVGHHRRDEVRFGPGSSYAANPLLTITLRMYLKTQALGQVRASVGTTARHTQV